MNMPERLRLSDPYPHLGTGPVPVEPYISQAYFEREREKIFRRMWLTVGRLNQIPKPGDFMVKKLAILGASVLVVHGDDGRVRAF
jgi:phenylpropionate dioxygenase-like ring-hydroxylating dioxygenase large terminal subunit